MWCVHLAVLGTVGGGLALIAHEWLLHSFGAVITQCGIAAATVTLGSCVLCPWHLESLGTLVKSQAVWANGVAEGGATGRCRAQLRPATRRQTTRPISAREVLREISRNTYNKNVWVYIGWAWFYSFLRI